MRPLEAALSYARSGLAVIPLLPSSKEPALCWGRYRSRAPDERALQRWWKKDPTRGLAVVMGAVSGNLMAVDIDPRNGGDRSIHGLHLPPTRVIETGGGGLHYYYRTSAPIAKQTAALPGVDILGEGSYAVAPPSRHPDGGSYSVALAEDPAPAPAWVEELLRAAAPRPAAQLWPEVSSEGERNVRLFKAASGFAEGRCFLCGGGKCRCADETHLFRRLKALNLKRCSPPLPDIEVRTIARSAWAIARRGASGHFYGGSHGNSTAGTGHARNLVPHVSSNVKIETIRARSEAVGQ